MNKQKCKEYLIAVVAVFIISHLVVSFVQGTLFTSEGGRFATIVMSIFGTAIYALMTEEPY